MVKVFKMRLIDYRDENEMMQHLQSQISEFRKQSDDLKVELVYRYGELFHVFLLVNFKKR